MNSNKNDKLSDGNFNDSVVLELLSKIVLAQYKAKESRKKR